MPRDRVRPLFIGIKGRVVALDRRTGAELWRAELKGGDFVNVFLDERYVYALTKGEAFCLDAERGSVVWHNPLKGLGLGLATMAAEGLAGPTSSNYVAVSEALRRQQQAAHSAHGAG
jgi:outer membrane protein assembly factor BamB